MPECDGFKNDINTSKASNHALQESLPKSAKLKEEMQWPNFLSFVVHSWILQKRGSENCSQLRL
jgi:hypothetical protein